MKRKTLTLREKLKTTIFNWEYAERNGQETVDHILRLIRDDRKRHCAECQRVKQMIEKQVEKLEKM